MLCTCDSQSQRYLFSRLQMRWFVESGCHTAARHGESVLHSVVIAACVQI